MAAGMTLIATKKPKTVIENKFTASDWLPKYNNSGIRSVRLK